MPCYLNKMATIKILKKEIEKYAKITSELLEKINLMGIPIESISEDEIELEVMPNRPDTLSVQGYLRAFKSYLGKEPGLKKYKIFAPEKNYKIKIDSSVKDIRPFTACAIVKNISFDNERIREIIDLQEKLHHTIGRNRKKIAIGIYPLEKIKLPITYTALHPDKIKFIPLESAKEMTGRQILQKHPTGKEYAHLLNGFEKYPVFIDSKNNVLSMPPIINSNETGKITNDTKEIFIECSGFDISILKKTLNIIVTTFADMGGKVYQMELSYAKKILTPDLEPETMPISLENTNSLLGLNLKEADLSPLLEKMGYSYKSGHVQIPAWRTDILHEVDIIEDIAIAYGYDSLEPKIPNIAVIGEESHESRIKSKLSEILIGLGLIEVSSYHLIKQEEAKKNIEKAIELKNSKTEYKFLRPNLLIPALRILSENKDNEYPQKIFEIGIVFTQDSKNQTETSILEKENLIIAATPSNFTEIKQILDYLAKMLNIQFSLKEMIKKELKEGRTAKIIANNKPIGYFGELHPKTLKEWNIKMPLSVLEISLEEIFSLLKQKSQNPSGF